MRYTCWNADQCSTQKRYWNYAEAGPLTDTDTDTSAGGNRPVIRDWQSFTFSRTLIYFMADPKVHSDHAATDTHTHTVSSLSVFTTVWTRLRDQTGRCATYFGGGIRFKSWPRYWITWTRIAEVFVSGTQDKCQDTDWSKYWPQHRLYVLCNLLFTVADRWRGILATWLFKAQIDW